MIMHATATSDYSVCNTMICKLGALISYRRPVNNVLIAVATARCRRCCRGVPHTLHQMEVLSDVSIPELLFSLAIELTPMWSGAASPSSLHVYICSGGCFILHSV